MSPTCSMGHSIASAPVPVVVRQHVEGAASLRNTRSVLVRAPHVKLSQLRRLDDRLLAHLDGIVVAGHHGWACCREELATPGVGPVFAATVCSLESGEAAQVARLTSLAQALPGSQAGLTSAFGWVSPSFLKGTTRDLLLSDEPFRRRIGLAACAMHLVQPGPALDAAIASVDHDLRAAALAISGQIGRGDLLPACLVALDDENARARHAAARSAVLLGDRGRAMATLHAIASEPGAFRATALDLWLKVSMPMHAQAVLHALSQDPALIRLLIKGIGAAGDPRYLPWLIERMGDLPLSRLAGESFCLVTGIDLAGLDLERKPAAGADLGGSDDPENDDFAMDEDDGLPWPNPGRIAGWWQANGQGFPADMRFFMGEPVNVPNCRRVLRKGSQRQRIAAAEYLCLLQPGTPLFPISAPAWRQQRWLDAMGA
jgi:uncharacterized protein (TIGR02270 family)